MQFQNVFFDLDGTIINSFEGVTKSVQYAMEKFNFPRKTQEELRCFIGPPLLDQFMSYCNFTKEQAEQAIIFFRERYQSVGWKECELIEGTEELLKLLHENGVKIVLSTSKLETSARRIIEYFGLDKYFDFIAGSLADGTRIKKHEVINFALNSLEIDDLSSVLMIGDRFHDIEGARKCGIKCVGVLCGFGSKEEFIEHNADFIAEKLIDTASIIL